MTARRRTSSGKRPRAGGATRRPAPAKSRGKAPSTRRGTAPAKARTRAVGKGRKAARARGRGGLWALLGRLLRGLGGMYRQTHHDARKARHKPRRPAGRSATGRPGGGQANVRGGAPYAGYAGWNRAPERWVPGPERDWQTYLPGMHPNDRADPAGLADATDGQVRDLDDQGTTDEGMGA